MSDLALIRSYNSLALIPISKIGCGGSHVGFFWVSIVLISSVSSQLALCAICSPNKVPTPIPAPL